MRGTIEQTIEMPDRATELKVVISFVADMGEPTVLYQLDGSGHPGIAPFAELVSVHVKEWRVGCVCRDRTQRWVWNRLDKLAHELIERHWDEYEQQCLDEAAA